MTQYLKCCYVLLENQWSDCVLVTEVYRDIDASI